MQITVEVPDRIGKQFKKKFKPTQQKKIITEFIKNEISGSAVPKKDSFIKWLMKPAKRIGKDKSRNVAEHHDNYIYT